VRKCRLAPSTKSAEGSILVTIVDISYRRGKSQSGDVDIIISNSRPHATQNLCVGLVKVLKKRRIITHTLTISTATSDREENPKHSFRQRASLATANPGGMDSLDKALVVFLLLKDNMYYTGIHRRVDLIIAPWRAWGTAIVRWTGGTTFERDMRLWATKKMGLKFDSGEIMDRVTGDAVQLVPPEGASAFDAEKQVFERLGLEYVPPTMRNTG
jgi:DNA polymerase IV